MKYSRSKIVGGECITVKIRLDDECKNGHQDFSITGDIYQAEKPKIDKYLLSGGCIHESILEVFPEFKQFVDLHLCDFDGVPMHAVANMHYHLYTGFNKTKPNEPGFKDEYCSYYRITVNEFDTLKQAEAKTDGELFHYLIETLPIRANWKKQAEAAILELEKLTNSKFVNTSTRSQYTPLAEDKLQAIKAKIDAGYYLPAARAIRANELKAKQKTDFYKELDDGLEKMTAKANKIINIKKQLYELGGMRFVDNVIYYDHTGKIECNWRNYGDQLTESEVKTIHEKITL